MDGFPAQGGPQQQVDGIAERLRLIRTVSQQQRYHGRPTPRLPSRPEIIQILLDSVGVLYPRHFGPPGLLPDQALLHKSLEGFIS